MSVTFGQDRQGRAVVRKHVGNALAPHIADALVRKQAEVLEAAQHPGTVEFLGIEPVVGPRGEPRLALVLGPIDGPGLDEVSLTTDEAVGILGAVASIVADLHEHGVVHGAIRAEHVLLDQGVRPRLCGFGSARVVRERGGAKGSATDARLPVKEDDVYAIAVLGRTLLARAEPSRNASEPVGSRVSTATVSVRSAEPRSIEELGRLRQLAGRRGRPRRKRSGDGSRVRPLVPHQRGMRRRAKPVERLLAEIVTSTPRQRPTARSLSHALAKHPGASLPRPRREPVLVASVPVVSDAGASDPFRAPPFAGTPVAPELGDAALGEPVPQTGTRVEGLPEEDTDIAAAALQSPAGSGRGKGRTTRVPRRLGLAGPVAVLSGVVAISATTAAVLHRRAAIGTPAVVVVGRPGGPAPISVTVPIAPPLGSERSVAAGKPHPAVVAMSVASTSSRATPTSRASQRPRRQCASGGRASGVGLADIDRIGCGSPVAIRGATLQVGAVAFALGGPHDRVTVGDWNCDGWVTPVLLSQETGSLYRYDTWPTASGPVRGISLGPIPHAVAIRALRRDRCDDLLVTREDGSSVVIAVEVPNDPRRVSP